MESHCTMRLLVPCLLLLISATFIDGFQSDELSVEEDDSEATPVTAPVIEKPVLRQSVSSAGEVLRSTGGASADGPTHDRKIEFNVEHAFGDSRFTPAGMISARLRTTSQGRQSLSKFRISRTTFSEEEQKDFDKLVKTDGFYSVRVPVNLITPGNTYVQTSVKARCLAVSELEEHFDLHLDQGHVVGLSLRPVVDCPYPRPEVYVGRSKSGPKRWEPKPRLVVKHSEPGPKLVAVLQEIGILGEEGLDGEAQKPPEKTFWQKYWMYIIPVGMIVLNAFTTLANMPEEGAAGQGGPQAGAQRASGQVQRRR